MPNQRLSDEQRVDAKLDAFRMVLKELVRALTDDSRAEFDRAIAGWAQLDRGSAIENAVMNEVLSIASARRGD